MAEVLSLGSVWVRGWEMPAVILCGLFLNSGPSRGLGTKPVRSSWWAGSGQCLFQRWLWRPARYRGVRGQYSFCAWVGGDVPRLGVWLQLRKWWWGHSHLCGLAAVWPVISLRKHGSILGSCSSLSPALWLSVREQVLILLLSSVTQRSERPPTFVPLPSSFTGGSKVCLFFDLCVVLLARILLVILIVAQLVPSPAPAFLCSKPFSCIIHLVLTTML